MQAKSPPQMRRAEVELKRTFSLVRSWGSSSRHSTGRGYLHDAIPEHLRSAILLGAFAGLRTAEVAGLRRADVDFMRGLIVPAQQHGGLPLKSGASATAIPIPRALTLRLSEAVARGGGEAVVSDEIGRPISPWAITRAVQRARGMCRAFPTGSGSTTCGTTTPPCSSRRVWT